ncbi:putative nuclease HARBI1 [Rhagoletis pomonella]|uniref:putative nuclease HARBI1 n=1 Tax=Rhagoletis pomonella TaxID=28610 RepID=UPI00178365D3|nr:putative nuclease HARBI1 [Rhagoletis pomonella]
MRSANMQQKVVTTAIMAILDSSSSDDDELDIAVLHKIRRRICLQGICNEEKKFINTFVGYPGSCHDSWVFQNSPIYNKLPSYCGDYYILGDSAYPCSKYVITPYRDNGHLTRAQKTFNYKLSTGRVAIEHTFGILKQRFRQLYFCKLKGMEKLCHFIRACCVLHNIANEDDLDFEEERTTEQTNVFANQADGPRGNAFRDAICQNIQHNLNQNP